MSQPDQPIEIGAYQLENLLSNQLRFLFLDLCAPESCDGLKVNPKWLIGSQNVSPGKVLQTVNTSGLTPDSPIVLICENGVKSMVAATELTRNSFLNVFVVSGGIGGLPPHR